MKVKDIINTQITQQKQAEADHIRNAEQSKLIKADADASKWISRFKTQFFSIEDAPEKIANCIMNKRGYFRMECPRSWIYSSIGESVKFPEAVEDFIKELGNHLELKVELGVLTDTDWHDIDYPRDSVEGVAIKVYYE